LGVINGVRVQVDIGEFLGNQVEQAGLGQTFNLGIEVEALEDVARGQGKALDVRVEVFPDMVLVAEQLAEVEWRCVVEALPSLAYQERQGSGRPSSWPQTRPGLAVWYSQARNRGGAEW